MMDRDDRVQLIEGAINGLLIEGIVGLVVFLVLAFAVNCHAIWSALG